MDSLKLKPADFRSDFVAGLTAAIASIPDAMASAVMAGINPVQGLYAYIVGTPIAALTTSSVFMAVTTTSAMALATGSALAEVPAADQATRAVVILSLRPHHDVGSTLLGVLTRYARLLPQNGGQLMLAGVGENVLQQMERTEMFDVIGAENVFPATPRLGESVNNALTAARAWLDVTP